MNRATIYLSGYLLWTVTLILGFYILVATREVGLALLAVAEMDLKLVALMDKIGFFLFGLAGLALIILTEAYYRNGIVTQRLRERFALVTGIEELLLFLCHGMLMLIPGLSAGVKPDAIQVGAELVIGILGIVSWRWIRGRKRNSIESSISNDTRL